MFVFKRSRDMKKRSGKIINFLLMKKFNVVYNVFFYFLNYTHYNLTKQMLISTCSTNRKGD